MRTSTAREHELPAVPNYTARMPENDSSTGDLEPTPRPALTRRDLWMGYAIMSGLVVVLGLGFAVIVSPPLIDDFRGYWPLIAVIGLASTAGGFWYLLWRPR